MTDYEWMQAHGYIPDYDQLYEFSERVGKKVNDGKDDETARIEALEGR
jgi:hypothetical protein